MFSMPADPRRAVVLLSGGMDSAVCLAEAKAAGFTCHALSFDYGQRHRFELKAARRVAAAIGAADHKVLLIDLRAFGGSALTADVAVPKDRVGTEETSPDSEIPVTYVPARNTIFLAFALGYAETIGSADLFIGVNAVDYSGYPDCRPEFIAAFENMANVATRLGVQGLKTTVHTPLQRMSKADIVRRGIDLGVDFSITHSCYDPDLTTGRPCGHCDACVLRERGFAAAGLRDPANIR
jgi:7-cyano-7-deazaguanine synthase